MKKPIFIFLSIVLCLLGIAFLLFAWSEYIVFRIISFVVLAAAILVIVLRIRAKRKNEPIVGGITGFLNTLKEMIDSDKLFKIALVTFAAATSLCICGAVLSSANTEDIYSRERYSLEAESLPSDDVETTEPETAPSTDEMTTEEVTTEEPATEPPVTEPPATDPPATDPPATEPPATEPPVTNPPVTDPPVTQPPQNPENQITVYITNTGKKYHYANPCGNGDYYPTTLDQALQQGLKPCGKCVLN